MYTMTMKQKFYEATKPVLDSRQSWYESAAKDPVFQERGGVVYPYDTIAANVDPMFQLFEKSGFIDIFEGGEIKTVCDVGCANGELSYALAGAGLRATAIDFSYGRDQAPYLVASVSRDMKFDLSVVDMSVDRCFDINDIQKNQVYDAGVVPDDYFDLAICFGLLYHLRNPFAFLESLAGVSKYVILGTHLFTHTPQLGVKLEHSPLAYLVEADELNYDPTNYWIFTEVAFHRLVRRCGFSILGSLTLPNNPLGVAVPDRTDLGVRGFVMLKADGLT